MRAKIGYNFFEDQIEYSKLFLHPFEKLPSCLQDYDEFISEGNED